MYRRQRHPDRPGSTHGAITSEANGDTLAAVTADALRARFGLTKSEAAVAALLAEACSVAEAARRLHVRVFTVRAYLRRIYDKTGVTRQPASVRRLLIADG